MRLGVRQCRWVSQIRTEGWLPPRHDKVPAEAIIAIRRALEDRRSTGDTLCFGFAHDARLVILLRERIDAAGPGSAASPG